MSQENIDVETVIETTKTLEEHVDIAASETPENINETVDERAEQNITEEDVPKPDEENGPTTETHESNDAIPIPDPDSTVETIDVPKRRLTIVDVENETNIRNEDFITDSDSDSDDSVGSYVRQRTLVVEPDFFEELGSVPNVSSISIDVSVTDLVQPPSLKPSITEEVGQDTGKFVDPLTGVVSEEQLIVEEVEEVPEVVEEEEEGEEEEEEDEEDDDLLLLVDDVEPEVLQAPLEDDQTFETFLDLEPGLKKATEAAIDFEALQREEAARNLREQTEEFLDALLVQLVNQCEYVDPNTILRQNLDKDKLMHEVHAKMLDLDAEQKARHFLNRKTVEYFRRKGAFRSILEDNLETVEQEAAKYKDVLEQLDCALGKEDETKNCSARKIKQLELELIEWQNKSEAENQAFEDLVRTTLHRDNYDRLQQVVDNQLERMSKLRDEISQSRLLLLQRQHTFAVLVERLEKLENLGNGLRMRDFEHLQTETQALGKKIEERNAELSKLRSRCNADLHIMAHMKEKQQMMRNTISVQESALRELMEEKQSNREYLYNLKMSRDRVRKEIRELSFQGGLLDKPALMLDYDETDDRLKKARIRVENMRNKYTDIQQKIQILESKYNEK